MWVNWWLCKNTPSSLDVLRSSSLPWNSCLLPFEEQLEKLCFHDSCSPSNSDIFFLFPQGTIVICKCFLWEVWSTWTVMLIKFQPTRADGFTEMIVSICIFTCLVSRMVVTFFHLIQIPFPPSNHNAIFSLQVKMVTLFRPIRPLICKC